MIETDEELIEAYSKISPKYSRLKTRPWKDFQQYLSFVRQKFQIPTSGIMLDIGTGNCRNLLLFEDQEWEHIASDITFELLNNSVSLSNNVVHLVNNDMKVLSLRKNSVDFAICIASLHHLRSNAEVVRVLSNIKEILQNEKLLIISCWRRWKKGTRKKMIKDLLFYLFKKFRDNSWRHGDISLPWLGDNKEIVAERYYHLFTRRELRKIVLRSGYKIVNLRKSGGVQGNDNFFLLLKSN